MLDGQLVKKTTESKFYNMVTPMSNTFCNMKTQIGQSLHDGNQQILLDTNINDADLGFSRNAVQNPNDAYNPFSNN